jgi:hypothetical protein
MAEVGDNWRLVYKSLLLLEYMVKHGPAVRRTSVCACVCVWGGGEAGEHYDTKLQRQDSITERRVGRLD